MINFILIPGMHCRMPTGMSMLLLLVFGLGLQTSAKNADLAKTIVLPARQVKGVISDHEY